MLRFAIVLCLLCVQCGFKMSALGDRRLRTEVPADDRPAHAAIPTERARRGSVAGMVMYRGGNGE